MKANNRSIRHSSQSYMSECVCRLFLVIQRPLAKTSLLAVTTARASVIYTRYTLKGFLTATAIKLLQAIIS